ncbi:hypothetical protein MDMS009_736 [Methylophaga thiooxydans DMS010]|uniref:Uncharacterized protein n=1 Tax=Methylophaga thiooxydans DMS010 TaxID=637616 RepID=C0N3J2_9GAMM|nr:hypothetical protein MDMS009_736 [Methylophaga thiooxydans DMS010]
MIHVNNYQAYLLKQCFASIISNVNFDAYLALSKHQYFVC